MDMSANALRARSPVAELLARHWPLLGGLAVLLVPTLIGIATESWTGESQWSGDLYVKLGPGGTDSLAVTLPTRDRYLVMPVFDRQIAPTRSVGARLALGPSSAGTQFMGGDT